MLPRCKTWPHVTEHAQADQGLHSHPGLESHNSLCSQQHRTKGIKVAADQGDKGDWCRFSLPGLVPYRSLHRAEATLGQSLCFLFFFSLIVISTLCRTGCPDHRRQSRAQSSTSSIDKPGRCWTLGASNAKHG